MQMRRREFHGTDDEGRELFATLPVMQLAGVDPDGQPVLRTLNGVVDDGWVCFHGSPAGEKTTLLGQPVVVAVEETVARIPSYFMDPERACPATTLFRSAQVHGVLQKVDEPQRKARVLQRLMEKLQPDVFSEDELRRAHVGSTAWVGITDEKTHELVATARAISDGGKYAWVYDVCVRSDVRRRGLGQHLMRVLLDHPRVRGCRVVRLGTRDARSLYARYGFVDAASLPPRPYATTEMILRR